MLKMIKKKLILLGLFLLVLPLISALDLGTIQVCGGDGELIIACGPADENLTFLSRDVPAEHPGGPGGGGVVIDVEEVEEPEIEEEKVVLPFLSILGLDKIKYDDPKFLGFMLILFFLPILFIFIYKKKKKKKQTKKFKEKEEIPERIKEKDNIIFIVIAIIAVILLVVFLVFPERVKEPEEISKGLFLKIYDKDGNIIDIPEWFLELSEDPLGIFSIVRHPPAPACTARSQCSGYLTNPNIMCWNGKCVLGNVASMDLGVSVENPSDSEVAFTNIAPSSASPSEFWTKLDKTLHAKLSPGDPVKSWSTTSPMPLSNWEGTTQTFNVIISGTSEYTGELVTSSDSIQLSFDADPVGTFIITVEPPTLEIECSLNVGCGTDSYTGNSFCQNNDVWQNYITYICNNPGIPSSYCLDSTTAKLKQDCGIAGCSGGVCNTCTSHDSYSCYSSDVYWYNSCGTREDKRTECGSSGYAGSNHCYSNDVYRDYVTRGCSGSSCTESASKNKQEECEGGCTGNRCRVWECETVCTYGKCYEYCGWV